MIIKIYYKILNNKYNYKNLRIIYIYIYIK